MTWTTAAGRTYVTHPMDYHELTGTDPTQPVKIPGGDTTPTPPVNDPSGAATPNQPAPGTSEGAAQSSGQSSDSLAAAPVAAKRDGEPLTYDSILAEQLDPDREWCDDEDLPVTARKPQRRPARPAPAAPTPSPDDDTPPPF